MLILMECFDKNTKLFPMVFKKLWIRSEKFPTCVEGQKLEVSHDFGP